MEENKLRKGGPNAINFVDRDPINNIWGQARTFKDLKLGLRQKNTAEKMKEIESTGKILLADADPYKVKIGIQLLRLLLWENTSPPSRPCSRTMLIIVNN